MTIQTIKIGNREIAEIISDEVVLKNMQDALDLMGATQTEYIVLHEHNVEKDFFDLSARKLGEILQKFTNYHIKLAIIGNFETYPSKTLKDFIYESNKRGEYLFMPSMQEITKIWTTNSITS